MADPNVPKFVVGEEEVSGEKVKTGLSSLKSAGGRGEGGVNVGLFLFCCLFLCLQSLKS